MANPTINLPALKKTCVEPRKRMVAGRYGWAIHRFPIKGGLPLSVVWSDALSQVAARPARTSALAQLLWPEGA